jgi:Gly-Xaa carboxypeptidase
MSSHIPVADEKAVPLYEGDIALAKGAAQVPRANRKRTFGILGAFALISVYLLHCTNKSTPVIYDLDRTADKYQHPHGRPHHDFPSSTAELCPQVAATVPSKNADVFETMNQLIDTEAFLNKSVEWLSGAVRVPTESYDKMDDVGVDPRWEVFGPFHHYLLNSFPLM